MPASVQRDGPRTMAGESGKAAAWAARDGGTDAPGDAADDREAGLRPGAALVRLVSDHPNPSLATRVLRILAVGLGYALLSAIGDGLNATPAEVSPIWPAAGFALGATLLLGYPALIGVVFAVVVQEWLRFGVPAGTALLGAAAAAAGPAAGAWLVRRYIGVATVFADVPNTIRFLALAAVLGPAVSALLGGAAIQLFPGTEGSGLGPSILTWWVGDAIGVVTVAPIMLALAQRPEADGIRGRWVEFALMLAATAGSVLGAIGLNGLAGLPGTHVEGLVLPVLIWAALRFEVVGAAAAAICVAATLALSMLGGLGPFGGDSYAEVVSLQIHAGMLAIAALVLGAAIRSEQAARRAKTRFLANMSHELRTPLNAILGFADLIAAQPHGRDAARDADYARHIRDSGGHLLNLVNDVLDVARLEQDAYRLNPEAVDTAQAIAAAAGMVKQDAAQRRLTVAAEPDPDLPAVRADERALRQILLNLLTNAVKFTPAGGHVAVTTARERDRLAIAVTDTGPGIDPAEIPRLMRPFEQTCQPRSSDPGGTGLGLAISRTLAEQLGGSLTITSRRSQGTRATLRLPIAAEAP